MIGLLDVRWFSDPSFVSVVKLHGVRRKAFAGTSIPVAMAEGKHLFPFRTEKLSPPAPMVLHGRLCGRVGRRRESIEGPLGKPGGLFAFRADKITIRESTHREELRQ